MTSITYPTGICWEILNHNIKEVERLLESGKASVDDCYDFPGERKYTPIEFLFRMDGPHLRNDFKIVPILLKYGADPYVNSFHSLNYGTQKNVYHIFFETIKAKWFPVGIALRHLSANELMAILEELCPGAYCFPFHKRWQLVTFIKHFVLGTVITKLVKEKKPKTKQYFSRKQFDPYTGKSTIEADFTAESIKTYLKEKNMTVDEFDKKVRDIINDIK